MEQHILERRQEWKRQNRGKLKQIAEVLRLSYGLVSEVFNGTRHNPRVKKMLREANAPGFEESK